MSPSLVGADIHSAALNNFFFPPLYLKDAHNGLDIFAHFLKQSHTKAATQSSSDPG